MIYPDTGHRSCSDQFKEELMGRIEHFRQFHPDRREIVHVEETPIVDLLCGDAPESEPIGLIVEERVERVEAARVARCAIDLRHRLLDRGLDLRRFLAPPLETAFDDFL